MSLSYFHHQITLKTVCGFLDRFSDLVVQKFNDDGTVRRTIKVPIQYGNRDKFLQIVEGSHLRTDLNQNNPPNVEMDFLLPRIAVLVSAINADTMRHTKRRQKINHQIVSNERLSIHNPVPYNLDVEMTLMTKTMNDSFQILEQILPLFAPSLSIDVRLVDDMPAESIPVILTSISPDMSGEMETTDARMMSWNLSFTIKTNYHLPQYPQKIITKVTDNFLDIETRKKFSSYEMTAVNIFPTTTPENRNEEPVTILRTEYQ